MGDFQVDATNVVAVVQAIITFGGGILVWKFNQIAKDIKDQKRDLKEEIDTASKKSKEGVIGVREELKEMSKRFTNMNTDQYSKIHKQNDEIANLRTHMAERFLMKDDYDRLERKDDK